jgi:SAM-dependent methyltransferase
MPVVPTTSVSTQAQRADGNRRFYERRYIGAHYASQSQLQPDEAAILERYRGLISSGRILDLGVGGGRTTPFLLELSSDYVGVDYSIEMIERCRSRFPAVRFEVVDARDLSAFREGSFDFVLFSNNGIDSVTHEDRLRIFEEVRRILSPKGLFVFSSHNRNFPIPKPWDIQHFAVNPLRDPIRFGRRLVSYPLGIINYLRHSARNRMADDHCILVDSAHRYSLVHYRITVAAQKEQLRRIGFRNIEAVDMDGCWLSSREFDTSQSPWIQYVCRRRA